ncbi:DUF6586 family protein [Halomonas sp. HL-93]|uniref:DUF6586 family protein n=1 Tax=Halomonas sp. HL-93 TaxID=1666906 RepID=UPI0006DA3396|nr:DUF6586 family protein [Halomonas sp. HL-93]KPQ20648.1 MAG: hypothetical protein HLUCCO06_15385 [Halomonas sp. HL-93]SBR48281.1 hypothetical protein GA0071314_1620 [Halomonas sp. HL-93]
MSDRSRTNQLLYQAELLALSSSEEDEHAIARSMAQEEGALALFELALTSLLREVTEHARLTQHEWRYLLSDEGPAMAELQRLRDLAHDQDSWLCWLVMQLDKLHSSDGAAKRRAPHPGMIAVGDQASFREQLITHLNAAKREVAALRETSQEW